MSLKNNVLKIKLLVFSVICWGGQGSSVDLCIIVQELFTAGCSKRLALTYVGLTYNGFELSFRVYIIAFPLECTSVTL